MSLPLPAAIAAFAAVYFAIAQLSLIYATGPGRVSAIWPLAGIVLVALVRDRRLWPAILIGDAVTALSIGLPPLAALGVALATTAEALLGAAILRRTSGGTPSSDRLADTVALIAIAALGSGIGGLLGALGLLAGGAITPGEISSTWTTWWIGNLIGVLLVAPLLIRCDRYFRSVISPARVAEAGLIYGTLALVSWVLLRGNLDYSYLVAPLLIWAALRVGPRGAALATLLFAAIAIRSTTRGEGPFAQDSLGTSLLYLQTFVGVMAIVSLVLSAALAELRRVERALRLTADVGAALAQWREETTPQAIADLLASALAEVCVVHVVQPDGTQRACVAAPPALRAAAEAHSAAPGPPPQALLAVPRAEDGARLLPAGSPWRALFEALPAHAAVVAPLCLRGHVAGALALYWLSPGRSYRGEDLALIEDLAGRTVQALERARLEAHMNHVQKMESIGLLAGGIAHDFNNLLAIVLGSAALLRADTGLAGRADLDAIVDAGTRAQHLTRHLLAFSRRHPLAPRVVGVAELVRGVLPLLRRILRPQVAFSYQLHEPLGAVRIDVVQFEQVLMNLVINAQEAMPGGGALTLTASVVAAGELAVLAPEALARAYVRLALRDTGVGMSEEVRARVFEPFFTTKADGQGSGLGLASSYGIVHQSGGHITVTSAVGEGSTFCVYLPRVEAGAADA